MEYLHSLKQPDGSFLMHVGGEVDVRCVQGLGVSGSHCWKQVLWWGAGAMLGIQCWELVMFLGASIFLGSHC